MEVRDSEQKQHEINLYMRDKDKFPFDLFVDWVRKSSGSLANRVIGASFRLPGGETCMKRNEEWTESKLWSFFSEANLVQLDVGDLVSTKCHELCLDLDVSESMDPFRGCCKGSDFCDFCWRIVAKGAEVIHTILEEDFGHTDGVLWCFSGRRGFHCRVRHRRYSHPQQGSDPQLAKKMVNYMSVGEDAVSAMHPVYDRVESMLEGLFSEVFEKWISTYPGSPEVRNKFVRCFYEGTRGRSDTKEDNECVARGVLEHMKDKKRTEWSYFKRMFLVFETYDARGFPTTEPLLRYVMAMFVWPRLDVGASTNKTHLLRVPLSVHAGSGLICQPLEAKELASFDPSVDCIRLADLFGEDSVPEQKAKKKAAKKKLEKAKRVFRRFVSSYESEEEKKAKW